MIRLRPAAWLTVVLLVFTGGDLAPARVEAATAKEKKAAAKQKAAKAAAAKKKGAATKPGKKKGVAPGKGQLPGSTSKASRPDSKSPLNASSPSGGASNASGSSSAPNESGAASTAAGSSSSEASSASLSGSGDASASDSSSKASTSPPLTAGQRVLSSLPPPRRPGARYDTVSRGAYLNVALTAMRESSGPVLEKGYGYVSALESGACASDNERLRADCLIASARKFCKSGGKSEGPRCDHFMDIIASNVLSERELISTRERYDIMRTHKDSRAEVSRRLHRLYGELAVSLRLAEPSGRGLGDDIDSFCQANADRSSLSWQTCAAALVWFIGRHP